MKRLLFLSIFLCALLRVTFATDVTISSTTFPGFNPSGIGPSVTKTSITVTNASTAVSCSACLDQKWVGISGFRIRINGVTYTVAMVNSTSSLTLSAGFGESSSGSATIVWPPYVLIQIYSDRSFRPLGASYEIQPGVPGSSAWFRRYAASVISDGATSTLYTPQMVVPATTDSVENNGARYVFGFYRPDGSLVQYYTCAPSVAQLRVPPTTPTTLPDLCIYNATPAVVPNNDAYTKTQIDARFPSCSPGQLLGFTTTGQTTTCVTSSATLVVKEIDGSPLVMPVSTIRVPNNSLTDDGGGQVTINPTQPNTQIVFGIGTSVSSSASFTWNDSSKLFSIGNGTNTIFSADATNKILSIGNGTATIVSADATNGVVVFAPFGASAGNTTVLKLQELAANGTNFFGIKAADNITVDRTMITPNNSPTTGQVLRVASFASNIITTEWGTTDCITNSSNKQVFYNNSGACFGAVGFEYQSGASPNVSITAQNASHTALSIFAAGSPSSSPFTVRAQASGTDFQITTTGAISTESGSGQGTGSFRAAAGSSATGLYATVIGTDSSSNTEGGVVLGRNSNVFDVATHSIAIGSRVRVNNGADHTVFITSLGSEGVQEATGAGSVLLNAGSSGLSNALIAGNQTYPITNIYFGRGPFSSSSSPATINGTGAQGSDANGSDLVLSAGKGTGIGFDGNVRIQTSAPNRIFTPTTNHSQITDRLIIQGRQKTVGTNNTAHGLFECSLVTLRSCGGVVEYLVYASDADPTFTTGDIQTRTGIARFSAVNKGGSYTTEVTVVSEGVSVSAGTLAVTPTITTGTNKITFNLTPNTSLTTTSGNYHITWQARSNSQEAITILP